MTEKKKRNLSIVSDNPAKIKEKQYERTWHEENVTPPPDISYHTNPMYEKLLNFRESQKKKRFTVEDLLKW